MTTRPARLPSPQAYPPQAWALVEAGFDADRLGWSETVFAQSNGYLGVRATVDEGRPVWRPATLINGLHETWPIVHAEDAYGFARVGQTIVTVPDATVVRVYVDDEPLTVDDAQLLSHRRRLDLRTGVLTRTTVWEVAGGRTATVTTRRVVSLTDRHLLAIDVSVQVDGPPAAVTVVSPVVNRDDVAVDHPPREPAGRDDPRAGHRFDRRVLTPVRSRPCDTGLVAAWTTATSKMTVGLAVTHQLTGPVDDVTVDADDGDQATTTVTYRPASGSPVGLTKLVAYHHDADDDPDELIDRAERTVRRAAARGFERLVADQTATLDRFWSHADIEVDSGDVRLQQAVRWNLFQLAQAAFAVDDRAGIPAKGLTGDAYEGHFFWDTEIYVLPFLSAVLPRQARALLSFRHRLLDAARARAAELGHPGALWPWRTINGQEASAYYAAGTAQYHIDAAIAYAVRRYVTVSGDRAFLTDAGLELLVESARLWADLGFYGPGGAFHIHGVTGPDEYTTVVNDSCYTNLMAAANLTAAADELDAYAHRNPDGHTRLVEALAVGPDEPAGWRRAAAAMHVPYDPSRGIHPQDTSFLDREPWDLSTVPADKFPLLLHHHPLTIYRRQVIKQADVVLACYLLPGRFTAGQRQANFDFYDPLTTGDSSLSAPIQAVVAAQVGRHDAALRHFRNSLYTDLGDVADNTCDGVHLAAAGGTWQVLVHGFAGVAVGDDRVTVDPALPSGWRRLTVRLTVRGRPLTVTAAADGTVTVASASGAPLAVTVCGIDTTVAPGRPAQIHVAGDRQDGCYRDRPRHARR